MEKPIQYKIKKMSPQLLVTDISISIQFYVNKLGFEVDFIFEDFYAGIVKDGISIHLKSGKYSKEDRLARKENEDLDIVFSVNDIEKLYNDITRELIDIVTPLREMEYGKEFYVSDPDGYILGFMEELN